MAYNLKHPLVSVVIPSYNRWPILKEAIDSVLSQSYGNIEVIVVDDGSTDGTAYNIRQYYPGIIYLTQNHHGVSKARNLGIKTSKGSVIAFLDSDDYWHEDKLRIQLEALKDPKVSAVSCFARLINYSGVEIGLWTENFDQNELIIRNRVPGGVSGMVIKKGAVEGNEWFDESLQFGEDWKLWLKILRNNGNISIVPEVLVNIRVHDSGQSYKSLKTVYSNIKAVIDWMEYKNSLDRRKALAYLHLECARLCSQRSNTIRGIIHLFISFLLYPFKIVHDDNRFYLSGEILGLKKIYSYFKTLGNRNNLNG